MENLHMEKTLVQLSEFLSSRFFGKFRGIVKNTNDPDNQGRITATVPDIYGDRESPWAFPSSILAGSNYGLYFPPKEGDGVWIELEAGDLSRPIYSGFWWSKEEMPKEAGEDTRIIITPKGHKIILDDEGVEIDIIHADGAQINITSNAITLKKGSSSIVLSSDSVSINNGALEIK